MNLQYPQMNWNYNPYYNYPYQLPVNPYGNLMADGSHPNGDWADGPVESSYGHDSQEYNHESDSMLHNSSDGHEGDNGGGHSSPEDDGYLHHTTGNDKYRKPHYSHPAPHKFIPNKHYGKPKDAGPKTIHYHTKYISEGDHHGESKKGKNTALTALTLLGFFFFLNLLHGCVKDHMDAINPTVMIWTPNAMHKSLDKLGVMDSREKLSAGAAVASPSPPIHMTQMDYVLTQPSDQIATSVTGGIIETVNTQPSSSSYNGMESSFSNSPFSSSKQQIYVSPSSNHQYSSVNIQSHPLVTSYQTDFDGNIPQMYVNVTGATEATKPWNKYRFHSTVLSLRMPQIIADEEPEYYDPNKHAKQSSTQSIRQHDNQDKYDDEDGENNSSNPYQLLPNVTIVTAKPIMIWTAVSTNFRHRPFITKHKSNEDDYDNNDDTDLYDKPIYTRIT